MRNKKTAINISSYISEGSVLGLNYSGMHDTSVAVIGPDSDISFAAALERYSRVKQDGRKPIAMLEAIPWEKIKAIAIPTDVSYVEPTETDSKLLSVKLPFKRTDGLRHSKEFYDFIATLPLVPEFVCHQLSHAASAFWPSGFDEALCLTYDGGMCNSPWFGGLFKASRKDGILPLERFNAQEFAKVTSLYSFVTALLGFSPNKHEGKITGLAAKGKPSPSSRELLRKWFEEDFLGIESTMEWIFSYEDQCVPTLIVNDKKIEPYRSAASEFGAEVIAASVQEFAELHVLDILEKARQQGWTSQNLCLAGGLFANVKLNQKISESGFHQVFVAPPMTDDGAALGAAWHVASLSDSFIAPSRIDDVYLGEDFKQEEILSLLNERNISYEKFEHPEKRIAELLAADKIVAVFQGRMEFGPRSLGNRSILASAGRIEINEELNKKLNRTEFMPFAPIGRIEEARNNYINFDRAAHCAEFMTITMNCTDEFKKSYPAVVHLDGTARPQVVSRQSNPFIHSTITEYGRLTGKWALINTSFNIHEEPIVCAPEDAIQGFFESGLDYLYLGWGIFVSYVENLNFALEALREKIRKPSQKRLFYGDFSRFQSEQIFQKTKEAVEKEAVIQELKRELDSKDAELVAKEKVIIELDLAYKAAMKRLIF